jgi:citryl-CoA lyase
MSPDTNATHPKDAKARPYWSTSVSDVEAADVHIRGYGLGELIGGLSFSAACFLLIRGRLPSPGEARMMDAILCSVLDYGLKKPGTVAARFCVSANPSMVAGLATAILSVGEYTLAPNDAGRFIAESFATASAAGTANEAAAAAEIDRLRAAGRRVPGFGHPNFRFTDPRAQKLKQIAKTEGVWGPLCDWYEALHQAFIAKAGKTEIVINEVGMMAAILAQLGFTPDEMTGIALLSSMPGVIAHLSEEMQSKTRIRTIADSDVDYDRSRRDLGADLKAAGWTTG